MLLAGAIVIFFVDLYIVYINKTVDKAGDATLATNTTESNKSNVAVSLRADLEDFDSDVDLLLDELNEDRAQTSLHKNVNFPDDTFFEGSFCGKTNDTFNGVCKKLPDCSLEYSYFKMLRNRAYRPWKMCGFIDSMPLVCCPFNEEIIQTIHRSHVETVVEISNVERREGEKQEAKIFRKGCYRYFAKACSDQILRQRRFARGAEDDTETFFFDRYIERSEYIDSVYKKFFSAEDLKNIPFLRSLETITFHLIGGTPAISNEFQPMAAIGYETGDKVIAWKCGGTLISDRFVLTAAHCTFHTEWGPAEWVRIGDLNLQRDDDGAHPADYKIEKRIRHPDYKKPSKYHDVALLKLEKMVEFTDGIKPACLSDEDFYGKDPLTITDRMTAIGWGKTVDDETSDHLLKVNLSKIDHGKCNKMYAADSDALPRGIVEDWLFCAGTVGKDTCSGDSGGPLLIKLKEHSCLWDVIGVTNFGNICGGEIPGVYLRVKHYISWIENVVWPSEGDNK